MISAAKGKVDYLVESFQAEMIACLHGVQAAVELVWPSSEGSHHFKCI